ncbi:UDP-N-acetylmuramate:L-alanyl-gamma-D-glutamyl-meso-diaminopimelate ligase [Polynucleobacter sp. IMCC30063]|uniref:UDP-N-acetylmuramate:L-alanyl-gamma-D-glutamyl- meso-diaminopimelate ligase n=1 Tax=Polynucleobacter sp. IMCC30063 TaxID=2907298 RepID=UPI001F1F6774|nr:UDP-N-acetylmuramate:L-alanyl-gamma-D-glutamyl-meso-diaminopimelate ligase [Polynucleobacter sp. IMCC30063]MCE7505129.1 UDP-N-acetylmuramate:L-alanyl-gamma-D-glutamyl-meso-diaminopimelate ligase [Polynucleobacter sp. IMCC30063]
MHIHILGICGTFMGGIAAIARQCGHQVTGCDANVYPPMSTQLEAQGIKLIEGYSPDQLLQLEARPDLFVIGNVVSRGNPLMESIMNLGLPYTSGPQWLGEQVLAGQHVLAVAGTHGKTTTAAMLAWILECHGLEPGYLIGGVPLNFSVSARLGAGQYFVIEADEYDTAFFDKRSKFVHYRPRTALLNNLEFDHADIFSDLAAIETQFHHLVRTVPGNGLIVVNAGEPALERVLQRGAWSAVEGFGRDKNASWSLLPQAADAFTVLHQGQPVAELVWEKDSGVMGTHNQLNALAAIAAAHHIGIKPSEAAKALGTFRNVKRRLEVIGIKNHITVYDDFAHHPTAIATTLDGLRRRVGGARILAVLEPRSNTMKLGVMKAQLPASLNLADHVFAYEATAGKGALSWDLEGALAPLNLPSLAPKALVFSDLEQLISAVVAEAKSGDHILVMSNGGFGGIHQKILECLA